LSLALLQVIQADTSSHPTNQSPAV
jgi:hypothetical protein